MTGRKSIEVKQKQSHFRDLMEMLIWVLTVDVWGDWYVVVVFLFS